MRIYRLGQVVTLALGSLVLLVGATAQTPDVPMAAEALGVPNLLYLQYLREVGFPAAAFFFMAWLFKTSLRENTSAVQELRVAITELLVQLRSKGGS